MFSYLGVVLLNTSRVVQYDLNLGKIRCLGRKKPKNVHHKQTPNEPFELRESSVVPVSSTIPIQVNRW